MRRSRLKISILCSNPKPSREVSPNPVALATLCVICTTPFGQLIERSGGLATAILKTHAADGLGYAQINHIYTVLFENDC